MTNEADKPSVEGLMDDLEYAVLARCQGHGSNACVKECRERLASEAAPAAQPATPLREVLSDERAKFQATMQPIFPLWTFQDDGTGGYHNHATEAARIAWQARALLAASSDEDRKLADRLKLEAQCHAQEARTANATIAEIYQLITGATGEPGNWHGAEPVRAYIAEQRKLMERALASKSESAKRGHSEAAVAFVTYDGAAADLNELARYVDRLEAALRSRLDGEKT